MPATRNMLNFNFPHNLKNFNKKFHPGVNPRDGFILAGTVYLSRILRLQAAILCNGVIVYHW